MDEVDEGRVRNPTLKDVAALSGVSIATASKALNNRGQVHPDTRTRVLEAAHKIKFRPNPMAQGLLAGQTGTVGMLTDDLIGRFSIPILTGAEDAFGTGRMSVFLCDARGDSIRLQYHLQALLGRRVDGLIALGANTDPRRSLGRDLPVPVVYVYGPSDDPRDLSLVPDNVGAGVLAAQHLISTGRRRIAHVTGERGYVAARDRAAGISETLLAAGLDLVAGDAIYGSWSESWGRTSTLALLDQHPDLDGIICGNDQIARGALDILREKGINVPVDVAVMGFDNWETLTTESRPQLTSVDMNLEELGRQAAQRLFAAIDGEEQSGIESLPCRLVVRASTALES
ncbi:LacI family DNA-binding transcriptional regulator [Leifsonia sp. NPDC058230]|uniref:LacI family DNA-binding transcriptional regulator n=1 Tax=Leifsonia sp. NPDC058230 TaxID=3346391 RepID=UPI0036DA2640